MRRFNSMPRSNSPTSLALARRLSDVADFLSVRPVWVAEPGAKKGIGILARPRPAAWPALCLRHRHCHSGGRLSRLPVDGGRSGDRSLLAQPARAAVLAEWAVVVSLAALGAELHGCRVALCRPRR